MKITFPQSLASWFNWLMGLAGAVWAGVQLGYPALAGVVPAQAYGVGMVVISIVNGIFLYIQGHPAPNQVTTTTIATETKKEPPTA